MPDKEAMVRVVQIVVGISLAGLAVALALRDLPLIVAEVLVLAALIWMIVRIRNSP
jgi:hypothetical protein